MDSWRADMFLCDEESEYQNISAIQAPKILAIQSSLWDSKEFWGPPPHLKTL